MREREKERNRERKKERERERKKERERELEKERQKREKEAHLKAVINWCPFCRSHTNIPIKNNYRKLLCKSY